MDKSNVETDLFNSNSQISETDLSLLLDRSKVDNFYNFYKFSTTFILFDDKFKVISSTFSFNPSIFWIRLFCKNKWVNYYKHSKPSILVIKLFSSHNALTLQKLSNPSILRKPYFRFV